MSPDEISSKFRKAEMELAGIEAELKSKTEESSALASSLISEFGEDYEKKYQKAVSELESFDLQ